MRNVTHYEDAFGNADSYEHGGVWNVYACNCGERPVQKVEDNMGMCADCLHAELSNSFNYYAAAGNAHEMCMLLDLLVELNEVTKGDA